MFLKNVHYIKSSPRLEFCPDDLLNEFLFLGKSNVGKSSLINALCNSKVIAKVSSTPGHTKYLNFFSVENRFRIVDSPGYGFALLNRKRDEEFAEMMNEYLTQRKNLRGAALLIDSKRIPDADDQLVYNFLAEAKIPFIVVATKCDRLNQSERSKIRNNISSVLPGLKKEDIYLTGRRNQIGFDRVIEYIYLMTNCNLVE